MKRVVSVLLVLLLSVVLSIGVSAEEKLPLLIDDAYLLTESEQSALFEKLTTISETYNVDVAVVTVESTEGLSVDDYVEFVYDEGGYGQGDNHDGVLLLVSMEARDYRILSNGFGATAITASEIKGIGEQIVTPLGNGNYASAFNTFVEECEYQINGEINGFPFDYTMNLIIALAIGLVVALIVTGTMKGQLKSVRKQNAATEYVKAGSMQVTASNDFFLYRTVDRRQKVKSSSSGGSSGSSRNVGGGKF